MILANIERYLDDHQMGYRLFRHRPTTSAQRAAAEEGVSGWQVAKTVAVELGSGEEVICVVPAPALVDLDALADAAQSRDVILCEASRLRELFPGCEPGAAPPFGGMWNRPVIFEPALRILDRILVPGGTNDTLIELVTEDYLIMERPKLARIAVLPGKPWKHALAETPGPHSWDAKNGSLAVAESEESKGMGFDQQVAVIVRSIPQGAVLSYREVAVRAGRPQGARAVSGALGRLHDLPWWRVVRSDRTLAPQVAAEQARRLQAEGVLVHGRRIVPMGLEEGQAGQ